MQLASANIDVVPIPELGHLTTRNKLLCQYCRVHAAHNLYLCGAEQKAELIDGIRGGELASTNTEPSEFARCEFTILYMKMRVDERRSYEGIRSINLFWDFREVSPYASQQMSPMKQRVIM